MDRKEWMVLIRGIGLKKVLASKDVDDAYRIAMEQYACAVEDILAVAGERDGDDITETNPISQGN